METRIPESLLRLHGIIMRYGWECEIDSNEPVIKTGWQSEDRYYDLNIISGEYLTWFEVPLNLHPDADHLRQILELNDQLPFGSFSLRGNDLIYRASVGTMTIEEGTVGFILGALDHSLGESYEVLAQSVQLH